MWFSQEEAMVLSQRESPMHSAQCMVHSPVQGLGDQRQNQAKTDKQANKQKQDEQRNAEIHSMGICQFCTNEDLD